MKSLPFEKYRGRLKEYLRARGVDASRNPTACFNAASHTHGDATPSLGVYDEHFKCFTCGIEGDIYDAAGIIEGIAKKGDQFRFIQGFFGDSDSGDGASTPPSPPQSKRPERPRFTPDQDTERRFEEWLRAFPRRKDGIEYFLQRRIEKTTGKEGQYLADMLPYFYENLLYWPGLREALETFTTDDFRKIGILPEGGDADKSPWQHSGVLVRLGKGYKLHYIQKNYCNRCRKKEGCGHYGGEYKGSCLTCEKRGTIGSKTFPMPGAIDPSLPVILVEGEMDALSCAAIGVKNVFSTGGTQGLTGELIREHLIGAAEIVFLFDGDEKGRSACGLDPVGDGGATAPQALRREGYQGMVRLAELPHDSEKSDPDSLAATGRRDVILLAIAEAAEYEPPAFKRRSGSPREEQQQTNIWKTWEDIPVTMLDDILSRIKKDNIDEGGAGAFITACIKACPHKDARQRLLAWGARTEELDAKSDVSAYYLLEICDRYGLPRSLRVNIENALVPPAELITENPWDVKINMKNIITSEEARQFVFKGDVQSAAIVVTRSAKGTLIYVESQKKWYAYNGLTWNREPDPAYLIYNILLEIINHFLKNKLHDKKNLWKLLLKIGERRFREDVTKDIRRSYGIHMEDIHFDSAAIRETITLADCVMDFRGNTVVYRNARPEEFRHRFLRYTREQVEETGYAQYMNFMEGNFKDPDTLETLLYYLSLVGSRNTGYKKIGVFIGPKHTGKSATLETLREIYYPSAVSVNSEVFIHFGKRFQNADAPSPTLAGMEGAMLAYISESQKGARFNTEILKRVSGGDEIKARKLYEDERGYLSTSQFIIASNYSPSFDADDSAFIDRLVIIPFKVQHKPGEKDTKQIDYLKNSLKEEFPGIVRVYAERYIKLKVELGGNIPLSEECVNYMNNYVEEQKSDIDLFLQDNFETGLSGEHFVTVADIYNRYLLYNDIPEDEKSRAPLDQKKLTYIIRRSGIEFKNYRKKRVGAKVVSIIQGIALKPWDPDQAPGGGLAIETASPSTGAEKEENPFIGGKDD